MESLPQTCKTCGNLYVARRSDSHYCKGGCRQKAHRNRQKALLVVEEKVPTILECQLVSTITKTADYAQLLLKFLVGSVDVHTAEKALRGLDWMVRMGEDKRIKQVRDYYERLKLEDPDDFFERTGLY